MIDASTVPTITKVLALIVIAQQNLIKGNITLFNLVKILNSW